MTARDLYENALIEMNKIEAPSLLLEDYNYFINKAIQQYVNLVYAKFEIDQQSADDIRVLKRSAQLKPKDYASLNTGDTDNNLFKTFYYVDLPSDYMHLLNCVVEYTTEHDFKCYNNGDKIYFAARRLTPDMYTQILNNAYLRPTYKRPYYYITNKKSASTSGDNDTSHYNSKEAAKSRAANSTQLQLELRYGNDDTVFKPYSFYIDYICAPEWIRLTQEQIDATEDKSQVLEFPDYVCYEIVNIFTRLLMENASDPRLQTNMPINTTIASPATQQQTK